MERERRILIVDDDPGTLEYLEQAITRKFTAADVRCRRNGDHFIADVLSLEPDVILLDIVLGEENGLDLCSKVKGHPELKHIPVILMSGVDTTDQTRALSIELGADYFLPKPIQVQDLASRLTVVLRLKDTEDRLRGMAEDLQRAQYEERDRLARELHDELGQLLNGIRLDTLKIRESMKKRDLVGEDDELLRKLSGIVTLVDMTLRLVQRMVSELRRVP